MKFWLSFDAGSIGTNTKGHMGAVFDGRNIYFVPYYDGTIYSGKVLKYDTTGEESSFKLVYSEAGQSGAFAGSPFGLNFYFSSGSYVYNLPLNEKLGYGWNHIVITRKDDVMRMYVNGILKNSKPVYGTINPSESVDLIIGNFQGDYGFKGVIDEVNIYNRSFNENEIVMEYNSNLRKFSDNNYVLNSTFSGLLPGEYSYYSKINDDGTLYVGEERTLTFDAVQLSPISNSLLIQLKMELIHKELFQLKFNQIMMLHLVILRFIYTRMEFFMILRTQIPYLSVMNLLI